MNVLVDSCGWIEYVVDGPLAGRFAPYIEDTAHVVVPTVVQYEVFKWVCREANETLALEVIGRMGLGQVQPLDPSTALLAAHLSRHYRLATADAVIYAHARASRVPLLTSDAHFRDLPEVTLFIRG